MQSLQLGSVLTPNLALQRGIHLERQRDHYSVQIVLYREATRTGPVFYCTTNHIVMTISAIERIAMYAFLHS